MLSKNASVISSLEPEVVLVPESEFIMGSTEEQVKELIRRFPKTERLLFERELPQHPVHLPTYYVGKTPVTNAQFARFIEDTGYVTTAEEDGWGFHWPEGLVKVQGANWQHPSGPESSIAKKLNHPVVQVSWHDAVAYCAWLAKVTRKPYRLPTEAEWEKASRGTDGRRWPWGDEWNPKICNCERRVGDTTPVRSYSPDGDSPFGCVDMIGNVWEWVSTTIGTEAAWPSRFTYPYHPDDGREDMSVVTRRVGRGGSWTNDERNSRCAFRFADPPSERYSNEGFRVALSVLS